MEELREFCERGLPITLAEEWDEFHNAKQLLEENQYQPDPDDPNTFIKVSSQVEEQLPASAEHQPLQIHFPENQGQPEYLPPTTAGNRNTTGPTRPPVIPGHDWLSCTRIQYDTSKLPSDLQIVVPARIPLKTPLQKQQSVTVQVKIHPQVSKDHANLLVHLQPEVLLIGVPRAQAFPQKDLSLAVGFYPCFTRFTLSPLFEDPSTVAVPQYTAPEGMSSDDLSDVSAARRTSTTGTRLGGQLSGWGIITFTAERSWETAGDEEAKPFEKFVPVSSEDGNAASFEWSILRWSDGNKYNARKPHIGFRFRKAKPPFGGGSSTVLRLQRLPGALWHLDPAVMSSGALRFLVHLEVEMHLVWFLGSNPFFKSPGSNSTSFEWRNTFEVPL